MNLSIKATKVYSKKNKKTKTKPVNKKQNQVSSPKKLKLVKPLYKIEKTLLKNATIILFLLDQNWIKKIPNTEKIFQ